MHRLLSRSVAVGLVVVVVAFRRDRHELRLLRVLAVHLLRHDLLHRLAVVGLDEDGRAGLLALEVDVDAMPVHVRLDAEAPAANVADERLLA